MTGTEHGLRVTRAVLKLQPNQNRLFGLSQCGGYLGNIARRKRQSCHHGSAELDKSPSIHASSLQGPGQALIEWQHRLTSGARGRTDRLCPNARPASPGLYRGSFSKLGALSHSRPATATGNFASTARSAHAKASHRMSSPSIASASAPVGRNGPAARRLWPKTGSAHLRKQK